MKKIFLSIITGTLVFAGAFAQLDRSVAPQPGPAPEINIANPEVFELDNGLKVILSSNSRLPKVSFNLVMTSDPRLEGNKAGLSEFLGDLMLSGTTNRDKDQMDREKDFIGASLSASNDNIFLSCLTKHMDKGLDLMTDIMKNANFPQSEFDRIKKLKESELATVKTNANVMAANATVSTVFGKDHPYGEVMTKATLDKITRDDIIALYKKQFTPAGAYLVIVGDIDLPTAKKVANERFGNWEGGVPFEQSYHKGILPAQNQVVFVEKPGAVQSVVTIAFPVDMKPGHEDQIKLTVLNKVFGGGGFGTRLMQNLREDKAWTYGAYSSANIRRDGSWMSASGSFGTDVTDSTIQEFLYEFKRITESPVSEEELSLNKASLAGSFARSLESPRTIASFALNIFRNDLSSDYYQTYLQRLNAVTADDLLEVAQKYFQPENLNIIVVGNKDVLDRLERFAPNGKIIHLDAFGNPATDKTYEPADISLNQLLENHLVAITGAKNMAKANKILGKIKSVDQTIGMRPQQAPVELTMRSIFVAPYSSYTAVQFSGMTVQKDVFNGTKGITQTMAESGGFETKELTPDEIEARKKSAGLFPELNILNGEIEAELLGMEEVNNKNMYVVRFTSGKTTTTAYYDSETFLKKQSESITLSDDGAQESNATYSDFRKVGKILFPHQTTQFIGSAGFESTIKEIKINGKIDSSKFDI